MDEKRHYRHQALPICTLGSTGHGRTTLTAALIKVVSRIGSAQLQADNLELQEPTHHSIGMHIHTSYRAIDYETSGRHYTHIDTLSHADNVKMLIGGSPKIGGAIWVVSAVDGVTAEAEAQIRLASQNQVSTVVTFLNESGRIKDPELIEICEMEMREILTNSGYAAENSPIIIGDAAKALKYQGQNLNSDHWKPIVDLIFAMNRCMPHPMNPSDLPLLMPIREVIDDPKGFSTLYGEILQGKLAVGHPVDVVGKGDRIKTRCVGLRHRDASSLPEDNGDGEENEVQVDAEPGWISPGQIVSEPKRIKSHADFEAAVYVMTQEECGTHIPLVGNDKPEIHLWTIDVTGHLSLPPDVAIINPGEHAAVRISLDVPMAMQVGTRFEIKKMGVKIGIGVVAEIID
jgi:elongation factor Tu